MKTIDFLEFSVFYEGNILEDLKGEKTIINTINPHCFCETKRDNLYRLALLDSDILLADGIGIVWAIKILSGKKIKRIAGSDLHKLILKTLYEKNGSCFYLGSSESVLSKIRERADGEFPAVKTSSYSPPYKNIFSRDESMAMINAVNDFAPDVLFVGMTAPKQEKWVHENRQLINAPVICSIGAVFDFYAGTVKRPGKFWISLGLEWLPRLLREPGRLWRRTLISTPLFLWFVLKEKFRMLRGRERGSEEE